MLFESLGDSIYSYANMAHSLKNDVMQSKYKVERQLNRCLENIYEMQVLWNGERGTAAPVLYEKIKLQLEDIQRNIDRLDNQFSSSENYVNNLVVSYNNYKEEKRRREEEERRRREEAYYRSINGTRGYFL